mmetsp:Transcript_32520/g.91412  ORF Transcript_32520/g.91412 Transcript_32520/m.91412 type:complete len:382 (-) Transcript_32520:116-1261(-)
MLPDPAVDAVFHIGHAVLGGDLDGPDGRLAALAVVHQNPDPPLPDLHLLEALALRLLLPRPLRGIGLGVGGGPALEAAGDEGVGRLLCGEEAHDLLLDAREELRHEELVDAHALGIGEGDVIELSHGIRHEAPQVLLRRGHGLDLQQDPGLPLPHKAPLGHLLLLELPERALLVHLRLPIFHHVPLLVEPRLLEGLHAAHLMLFLDLHHRLLQGLVHEHIEDRLHLKVEVEQLSILNLGARVDARLLRPVLLPRRLGQKLVGLRLHGLHLDHDLLGDQVVRQVHGHPLRLGHWQVEHVYLLRPSPCPRLRRRLHGSILERFFDGVLRVHAVGIASMHALVPRYTGLLQVPVHRDVEITWVAELLARRSDRLRLRAERLHRS